MSAEDLGASQSKTLGIAVSRWSFHLLLPLLVGGLAGPVFGTLLVLVAAFYAHRRDPLAAKILLGIWLVLFVWAALGAGGGGIEPDRWSGTYEPESVSVG